MRMVQAGNRPSLALEALPQIVAAADLRGENLDSHLALQSSVAGAVHLSHPTGAQGRNNLVGSQTTAAIQRHDPSVSYRLPEPVTSADEASGSATVHPR